MLPFLSVLLAASTGSAAAATAVPCGATIASTTVLAADVGPCNTGDGIVVRGSNIVLDLNGHRVFSTAPLPRSRGTDPGGNPIPDNSVGIHLRKARSVTVRGGTVEGFSAGVAIDGGGSNTVTGLIAQHNQGACLIEGQITPTQLPGKYGDGIVMFSSSNNRVLRNLVQGNGPFSGISVVTDEDLRTGRVTGSLPSGNVISGNQVADNATCRADTGIRIEGPGATHNTVSDNQVSGSDVEGIAVEETFNIDLSVPNCNAFPDDPSAPDTCPTFDPPQPNNQENVIKKNLVFGNSVHGPTRGGIGLLSFFSYIGASGQPSSIGANNNTVSRNVVTRNFGHGVAVNSMGNRILDNVAVDNNQAHCPHPPRVVNPNSVPNCNFGPFGGPFGPRFDLVDNNGVAFVPKIVPPPPPPAPFEIMFALAPGARPCDHNVWSGNVYATAFPRCTTAGGRHVPTTGAFPMSAAVAGPSPVTAKAPGYRLMSRGRLIQ